MLLHLVRPGAQDDLLLVDAMQQLGGTSSSTATGTGTGNGATADGADKAAGAAAAAVAASGAPALSCHHTTLVVEGGGAWGAVMGLMTPAGQQRLVQAVGQELRSGGYFLQVSRPRGPGQWGWGVGWRRGCPWCLRVQACTPRWSAMGGAHWQWHCGVQNANATQ